MGAALTRYRYLAHQEKLRKAIEKYKKRKVEMKLSPEDGKLKERSRTFTQEAIHSMFESEADVGNDEYYTRDEAKKYELKLEQVDDANPTPFRWNRGELIGCGAFGRVYLGMNLDTGGLMAIKEVPLVPSDTTGNRDLIQDVEREVLLLKQLKHSNIVSYIGTGNTKEALLVFMEYVPGGSIAKLLKRFGRFSERVVRVYTRQILSGVECLHRHGIMHRDIKGANILVDKNGTCKVSDFGAARSLRQIRAVEGPPSLRGTPYWMAPEVIMQTGHGRQADIWSVGCTVLEMLTGRPPWSKFDTITAALYHIAHTNNMPAVPPEASTAASIFIHACLQRNPRRRPNATRLLGDYEFVLVDSKPNTQPNTPNFTPGTYSSDDHKRISLSIFENSSPIGKRRPFGKDEIEEQKQGSLSERRGFPRPMPLKPRVDPSRDIKKPSSAGSMMSVSTPPKSAACVETPVEETKPAVPWGSSKDDEEGESNAEVPPPTITIEPTKKPQSSAPVKDEPKSQTVVDKATELRRIPSCSSSSGPNDRPSKKSSNPAQQTPQMRSLASPDSFMEREQPLLQQGLQGFARLPNSKRDHKDNICKIEQDKSKNPATREMIKDYLSRHSKKFTPKENETHREAEKQLNGS
mmetsp:Transcript_5138/g.12465  ORF Transcript_5138/g.12465 Transcript_5138/m.12465 type:complete len:634 (+) Transcript_5138:205-2106(+)